MIGDFLVRINVMAAIITTIIAFVMLLYYLRNIKNNNGNNLINKEDLNPMILMGCILIPFIVGIIMWIFISNKK